MIVDIELERIYAVINELGLNLDMQTFDGRLKLQKYVYLIQSCGLDLGYRYNWYIHGPYSPSLATAGFNLEAMSKARELSEGPRLKEWAKEKVKLVQWIVCHRPEDVEIELWLEILASLDYLANHVSQTTNDASRSDEVINELFKRKPFMSKYKSIVQAAWDLLDRSGLVD